MLGQRDRFISSPSRDRLHGAQNVPVPPSRLVIIIWPVAHSLWNCSSPTLESTCSTFFFPFQKSVNHPFRNAGFDKCWWHINVSRYCPVYFNNTSICSTPGSSGAADDLEKLTCRQFDLQRMAHLALCLQASHETIHVFIQMVLHAYFFFFFKVIVKGNDVLLHISQKPCAMPTLLLLFPVHALYW